MGSVTSLCLLLALNLLHILESLVNLDLIAAVSPQTRLYLTPARQVRLGVSLATRQSTGHNEHIARAKAPGGSALASRHQE